MQSRVSNKDQFPTTSKESMHRLFDYGTVSGLIERTKFNAMRNVKPCDEFYSDKDTLKKLKDHQFELVFSDTLYTLPRSVIQSSIQVWNCDLELFNGI